MVPGFFLVGAAGLMLAFLIYQPYTSWPGLLIALLGVPVYVAFRAAANRRADGLPE